MYALGHESEGGSWTTEVFESEEDARVWARRSTAPSNVEYQVEGARLVVKVSGPFDLEEAVRRFEDVILPACRAQNLTQVLIDTREVVGLGSAIQGIIYANQVTTLYLAHLRSGGSPFRVAHVTNPALVGDWNPGADALEVEGGFDAYVTVDIDAALAWLDT